MSWMQRGERRYYYRASRLSGVPRRQYVGTGPIGKLAAAVDDYRRLTRAIAAEEGRAEQARYREAESSLRELCAVTDLLARAALVAAGYRQHARGSWRRKRRVNNNDRARGEGSGAGAGGAPPPG